MSYDPNPTNAPRAPIRTAMLDLISRNEAAHGGLAGPFADEARLLAALQEIVAGGQDAASHLRDSYHGDRRDSLARVFADYAY